MVQEANEAAEWQRKVATIALVYGLSRTEAERVFTKYVQRSPCCCADCYRHILYDPPDW